MKQTAVDKAYSWIRSRIIDGTLPGGSFIDEAAVCDATGVSRTPAREAFNRLEGERFIKLVPRRGAQVRELNLSDLHDAYDARFMVESFAAADFCAREDSVVPAAMYENLKLMDTLNDFPDTDAYFAYQAADQAFHGALVNSLNNRAITDFFNTLWRVNQWGMLNRSSSLLRSESYLDLNRHQHHDIVKALEEKDQKALHGLLREHLRYSLGEFSGAGR